MKKIKMIAFVIIICLASILVEKTFQNDTFYIIKVGQSITHYGIDMVDHFSFHNIGYPYEHWLFNLIVYFAYALNGLNGVYILTILLTCILGIILYVFNSKLSKNDLLSLLLTILSMIICKHFFAARSQLISYIIFVCEIFFIEQLLSTGKKKYVCFLVLFSWLCANTHAAVWPMYIVLFMPYIATNLLAWYRNKEITIKIKSLILKKKANKLLFGNGDSTVSKIEFKKYNHSKLLLITGLLCIFIALFTPNHFQPFTYYFKVMQGHTTDWIAEHSPTVLINNKGYLFIILMINIYLIFIKCKIHIKDFLMLLGLIMLSIMSYRHISLFILLGSFSICKIYSDYIRKYYLQTHNKFMIVFQRPIMIAFITIFSFSFTLFIYSFIVSKQPFVGKKYPIKAARYINENVDKKKMRLFNQYGVGSYLLYKDIPVFIDSRANLYTKPFSGLKRDIADDWYSVEKTGNYKKIFKYYKITHVLCKKNSNLDNKLRLDKNYQMIYKDKRYVLFEKIILSKQE